MTDFRDYEGVAPPTWEELYERAREARERAWVPYSDFEVGAALLTADDEIFVGCNVENASIGATICAERTAIGTAVSQGIRRFRALCIVTDKAEPAAPCGICRQFINEFAPELPIVTANLDGDATYATLDELLPRAFSRPDLDSSDA